MKKRCLFVLLLLNFIHCSWAIDYYVSINTGSNSTGAGTKENPWKTINYALLQASTGDIVRVMAGTYNSTWETLPIQMIDGVSLIGEGSDSTIIDGSDTHQLITCTGFSNTVVIEGFKLTGGYSWDGGTAIDIYDAAVIIRNNEIVNCRSGSYDGTILVSPAWSDYTVIIEKNIIKDNIVGTTNYDGAAIEIDRSWTTGGITIVRNNLIADIDGNFQDGSAISVQVNNPVEIYNNTITGVRHGFYLDNGVNVTIRNNIIANCSRYGIFESGTESDPTIVHYNLFYNNTLGHYYNENTTAYTDVLIMNEALADVCSGNIEGDPLFVNPAIDDYHLQSNSPCINTGDPDPTYNDPNGSRNDIGAYHFESVSSENDILAFSFSEQTGPAIIDTVNHTVDIEVAEGTDPSDLIATFTLSALASVKINDIIQESGVTANNFTNPVSYTVFAEDNTTQDWVITVTVEIILSSEKDILSFSFAEQTGPAIINDIDHTISIEVIHCADITNLAATFTISPKAIIKISGTLQESGITTVNFSNLVTYSVTAEDNTIQDWLVTVTVIPSPSSENDFLSFSFQVQTGPAVVSHMDHKIDIEVFNGTVPTNLIATFTISLCASSTVNSVNQVSGVTGNDFSDSVTYLITAEDGTAQEWIVTVTVSDISVISLFPYFEDFEGGSSDWYSVGANSSWEFGNPSGITISSAYSDTTSWITNLSGNYNPNEVSFVYSPPFDFTNLNNPAVEMKVWWDTEGIYDGICFQYSVDTSKTWITVEKNTDYNWFNRTDLILLYGVSGSLNGWSGDGTFGEGSNGWVDVIAPLTELNGIQLVRFRFLFVSNGSYEKEGFAFDDFKIYMNPFAEIESLQDINNLKIYPNPFNKRTIIEFNNSYHSSYILTIKDLSGKVVRIIDNITQSYYELDRADLSKGIYLIELRGDNIYRGKILIE